MLLLTDAAEPISPSGGQGGPKKLPRGRRFRSLLAIVGIYIYTYRERGRDIDMNIDVDRDIDKEIHTSRLILCHLPLLARSLSAASSCVSEEISGFATRSLLMRASLRDVMSLRDSNKGFLKGSLRILYRGSKKGTTRV